MDKIIKKLPIKTLQTTLKSFEHTLNTHTVAVEEANKLKVELEKLSPKPKIEQKVFAFFPIELMRTSLFFPVSRKEINRENRKIEKLNVNHSWGSLEIEGVKLAVYQEDILLKLLIEKDKALKNKNNGFSVEYSMNSLAKGLGSRSGADKAKKKRIEDTLDDFRLVQFKIIRNIKDQKNKTFRKVSAIGNIVESYDYDEKTDKLIVNFAPRFWSLFGEGLLAGIDLSARNKLSFDCSKILLRFLQTHRNFNQVNLISLMKALNYNVDQPASYLKKILDKAIKELIKKKQLDKKSGISEKKPHMVFFYYPKQKKSITNKKSICT